MRRLFPEEAEAALAAPDVRTRVERFTRLFQERHFPLYASFLDLYWDEGDESIWTWLRRGIPFELFGFGYDDLHEVWDRYRDGLSAMVLLVRPPDSYYEEPDGLRVAWLESAAARIPQETLLRIPEGGIPLDALTEALKGTGFGGAAQAAAWVWGETGNFFLDASYEDGKYDGFADPCATAAWPATATGRRWLWRRTTSCAWPSSCLRHHHLRGRSLRVEDEMP